MKRTIIYQTVIKRIFDIIIGLVALPFVILIIFCMAPIIWFTDNGPVFYNAIRIGKDCRPFKMYKLRSMYVNSPDIRNSDGSTFNSSTDSRVTPIGGFLRKTSLDEFPQFLNILKGDMSFIGPRPKVINPNRDYNNLDGDIKKCFSVKPGITGYSQAYYRNLITNDDKIRLDAFYADNMCLSLDIKIIIKTIKTVLLRENINSK